jgi:cytoskeletal protein CcmA (bactofilin family)
VEIKGNAEGESVDVGGKVGVEKNLTLTDKLDVGGTAEVHEELKAKYVDVGGSLKARKAEVEASVDVGGKIETSEGVKAAKVEIGRKGRIIGVVVAEEVQLEERAEADDIYADSLVM